MRKVVLLAAVMAFSAGAGSALAQELKTDQDKTIYALGVSIGQNIKVFNLTKEELALVVAGLSDATLGQKPKVELETFGPKIGELARTRMTAAAEAEKVKGAAYLERAAKEPGAIKSETGLVYKILAPGDGASPTTTDRVKVNYRGTLIDGTEFDSSAKGGRPIEMGMTGFIPCWTEVLQKLKPGGKVKVACPSSIGYGDRGHPPGIPGGATLLFDMELVEVIKPAPPATPPPPGAAPPAPKAVTPPPAAAPTKK